MRGRNDKQAKDGDAQSTFSSRSSHSNGKKTTKQEYDDEEKTHLKFTQIHVPKLNSTIFLFVFKSLFSSSVCLLPKDLFLSETKEKNQLEFVVFTLTN